MCVCVCVRSVLAPLEIVLSALHSVGAYRVRQLGTIRASIDVQSVRKIFNTLTVALISINCAEAHPMMELLKLVEKYNSRRIFHPVILSSCTGRVQANLFLNSINYILHLTRNAIIS